MAETGNHKANTLLEARLDSSRKPLYDSPELATFIRQKVRKFDTKSPLRVSNVSHMQTMQLHLHSWKTSFLKKFVWIRSRTKTWSLKNGWKVCHGLCKAWEKSILVVDWMKQVLRVWFIISICKLRWWGKALVRKIDGFGLCFQNGSEPHVVSSTGIVQCF